MKKILALILALMLAVPASVFAFAAPAEMVTLEPIFKVNPLYEGIISVEKPERKIENGINAYGVTYYTDIADVGAEARENLKNRAETFTVGYKTADFDGTQERFEQICDEILSCAFMHTGVSDEGDYIQWHWEHYQAGASYSYNGTYYSIGITFYFDYYTTAAQEEAVTEKLEEVYEELQLEDKNDYYKICAIYDYICDNVVYDYANLNNENYKLQYTAYAALINGTSVCQGYANLFYRMALDWGVDARLIAGDAGGGHAWNIVKMGDYYYNLDSTWDAGLRPNYMWFLKCPDTFVNHYRDYEYETAEFHAAYPMGATDYVYNESDFEDSNLIASGYCGGEGDGKNLKWGIDKDGVLTISGEGKMEDYDYGYINGFGYITTAPWGEYTDELKALVIEEGVTVIGEYAFAYCKNFTGTLVMPDSLVEIGDYAFLMCSGFTGNLIIGENVTFIRYNAFEGCSGFTGNLIIPDSVEVLSGAAFENCSGFYGTLKLGNNLEAIGEKIVSGCYGISGDVIIPKNVNDISYRAFSGSNIESLTVVEDNTTFKSVDGVVYTKDGETLVICPEGKKGNLLIADGVKKIKDCAFENCDELIGELIIPDSVDSIGNKAFLNCSGFTKITLGENVEYIQTSSFEGCTGFTGDLIIPNKVSYVGGSAFKGCSGFDGKLVLGESLIGVGSYAFYDCTGFEGSVIMPKTFKNITTKSFLNCGINDYYFVGDAPYVGNIPYNSSFDVEVDTIYYPEDNDTWEIVDGKWKGYNAKSWDHTSLGVSVVASGDCGANGDNLKWSLDSEGVLTISGSGAMKDYSHMIYEEDDVIAPWREYNNQLKKLVIEEGVTTIGNYAFYECYFLKKDLVFPNSVTSIGDYAFYGCHGFTGNLVIGNSVTSIGEYAFYNCSGFTGELVIPDGVTTIENSTFYRCSSFAGNLVIPDSVTSIGQSAFANCSGFTGDLVIPGSVTSIGNFAFYCCFGFNGDLVIENGVTTIGNNAFRECLGLTGKLVIPDSVTSIEFDAFAYCSGLTGDLVIPDSVKSIGNSTFKNCGINDYYFEGDAPTVESNTFDSSNDTIYYPKGNDTWNVVAGKWNGYNAVEYRLNGDLDGDAKQTVEDVYMIRLVIAKLRTLTEEQKAAADLDGDGKVTAIDANILRKYILGIIPEIPVVIGD